MASSSTPVQQPVYYDTVVRLFSVAAVVYGIVAVVVAGPVLIIGTILLGRLLELIPGPIWIPYAVLGAILVIVGIVQLIQGQIIFGIVLIIVGALVGPGGISIVNRR